MNARTLTRLAVAPLLLTAFAACSAAPESTGTSDDAIKVGGPIIRYYPPAPPWPVPTATYCPNWRPACTVTEESYADWSSNDPPFHDAQLKALGCTPPLRLATGTANGVISAMFAVCYDTPAVRATFWVDENDECSACMPELPAGQIYVLTGYFAVGPNCPSGCPGNPAKPGGGTVGGGTGVSKD